MKKNSINLYIIKKNRENHFKFLRRTNLLLQFFIAIKFKSFESEATACINV